ncbi:MAG: FAD-dependent oxidoreductase [Syntrophales bacterium]|jgi:hypothetical protein|nr:FAD-dependent oxidoreductase [Syntrophales bacterium]
MGLALGKSGAIAVNFSQQTSVENIYAAGDCCESFHRISKRWGNIPLGDIANKQGRVAGSNIGGKPMIFPGVVGAQSFQIFSLEAAATGLTESEARVSGFHPVSLITWGNASANAMPDAKKIGLKLIADGATARLIMNIKLRFQKIYEVDPLVCPKCQGAMRIISFIEDPSVIRAILEHLGLWLVRAKPLPKAHAPPIRRLRSKASNTR